MAQASRRRARRVAGAQRLAPSRAAILQCAFHARQAAGKRYLLHECWLLGDSVHARFLCANFGVRAAELYWLRRLDYRLTRGIRFEQRWSYLHVPIRNLPGRLDGLRMGDAHMLLNASDSADDNLASDAVPISAMAARRRHA